MTRTWPLGIGISLGLTPKGGKRGDMATPMKKESKKVKEKNGRRGEGPGRKETRKKQQGEREGGGRKEKHAKEGKTRDNSEETN